MPEANYKSTSKIKVYSQIEATFGTPITGATGWSELPVTSFTMPEASAPLELSTARSGHLVDDATMASHNLHAKTYTFDITMKGSSETLNMILNSLIEDSGSPYILDGSYVFPDTYKDATTSATQYSFLFKDASPDATATDLQLTSCIPTSVTIAEGLDAENGELTITSSWITAYKPVYLAQTITTPAVMDDGFKNIKNLTTYDMNSIDLHLFAWEISFNRNVERIGAIDYTDHKPYGYAMVGSWEVGGSVTCKRDDGVHDLLALLSSGTFPLNIAETSNFTISMPCCKVNEATMDTGSSVMMQNIPFNAYCTDPEASDGTEIVFSLAL